MTVARDHRALVAQGLRVVLVSCALLFTSGCGLLLQTAVGWHKRKIDFIDQTKSVEVTSSPNGAAIVRRSPGGEEVALGDAPLVDSIPYQIEQTTQSPSVYALLLGAAVQAGLSIAVFNAAASTNEKLGYQALGAGLVYLAVQDLAVALIHGLSGSSVASRKTLGGSKDYLYAGTLSGYPDGLALIRIPDQGRAMVVLSGIGTSTASPSPGATAGDVTKTGLGQSLIQSSKPIQR